MMARNNILRIGVLATTWSLLWSLPAFGQQDQLEEVVVTGSYLPRPVDRPQPVAVLTHQDLIDEQKGTIGEILKDMTITNGSISLNNIENGTSPTAAVNLRGLGPRATLVLLNSRRQTVDASVGQNGIVAVDINNLAPAIMLERIEVLTDGASALYGSDAVAGVVNLITRRNFEGAEISVRGLDVDRNGASEFTLGAIFGSQGRDTSIVAAFEFTDREMSLVEDFYPPPDPRLITSFSLSSFGNPGSFIASSGMAIGGSPSGRFADPLCGSDELTGDIRSGIPDGIDGNPGPPFGRCALALTLFRNIIAETDRLVGLATIDHAFSDVLNLEVEMGFARARFKKFFGTGFPISDSPRPVVPASNPGVIAENARSGLPIQDYVVWMRMGSPVAIPAIVDEEQDTWRIVAALSGEINADWDWTATVTFSQNDTILIGGDTIRERFNLGLNCQGLPSRDTCFNPFANNYLASPGDPEFNDPALFDWIFSDRVTDGHAELSTVEFLVTGSFGELGGEPIGVAFGAQTRNQDFLIDYDPISNDGGFSFNSTPLIDFDGERDADAVFGEVVLYPTSTLEVQLAARYEDYGGGVDTLDPKLGLLWTPTERLYVRATAGTSFRVPGELQIFGQQLGRGPAADLGGELIDARALTRGDPNLLPEESTNFTIGVTWDATDNFSLDLNYWNIDFENLVVEENATVIWNLDIADGTIDDPRIILRPGLPSNAVVDLIASDIVRFELSYINQDFLKTDGVDFNFNWNIPAGANEFGIGLQGTKTLSYDVTTEGAVIDALGQHNTNNLGAPTPDYMAILRLDWRRGAHYARMTTRYIPKLIEDGATTGTQEIDMTTVDLLYSYTFGSGSFTAGVINATDEDAPSKGLTFQTVNSLVHDPRGRMYRVGFNWGF